jgi:hypothetical protein
MGRKTISMVETKMSIAQPAKILPEIFLIIIKFKNPLLNGKTLNVFKNSFF